jgi:hypothetical protein
MSEVFSFHELFTNPTQTAYIRRLEIDAHTQAILDDAVDAVKKRLRPRLRALAEENGVVAPYSVPRFRLQGSAVYGTQNYPARTPMQQVDADLGTYISAAFLDGTADAYGRKLPAKTLAKTYFNIVDGELRQLCKERGWEYVEGEKQNDRCCRINLAKAGVHAHIDVPLFAAPNDEFERAVLAEDLARMELAKSLSGADLARELDRAGWDDLHVIVMACRDGTWSESDVQRTIEHFKKAASDSGHPRVITRIWRFVKGWRDFTWVMGGPSSVLLMEVVQRIRADLDRDGGDILGCGRDDRILRQVFEQLASHLNGPVWVDWASKPENLNRAKTEQERAEWASQARRAAAALERAATEESLNFNQVISLVRSVFGQRISDDVTLIKWTRSAASPIYAGLGPAIQPNPQARVSRTSGA